MKAVALDFNRRALVQRDIAEPLLESDYEVLFKVREIGVCGTDRDLASFRLEFPPAGSDYLVLGHECVGEVLRAGSAMTDFAPGDIVVPLVRRSCAPPCRWCLLGRRDLCSSGRYTERGIVGAHGYFTEMAVDAACDLVRVPAELCDSAVLIEPLSVVEKAVSNALRLHPGGAELALVLGAGAVGLLAAMTLRARGLTVTVCSLESRSSHRGTLAAELGAEYVTSPEGAFDVVIEAAGEDTAARAALQCLAPAGVLVILGVNGRVEVPMLQLILHNQVIAGSVNASREDFDRAVEDLGAFPNKVLSRMIEREPWSEFRSTILGRLRPAPKLVHVGHET